jgi:hypothetical protein
MQQPPAASQPRSHRGARPPSMTAVMEAAPPTAPHVHPQQVGLRSLAYFVIFAGLGMSTPFVPLLLSKLVSAPEVGEQYDIGGHMI